MNVVATKAQIQSISAGVTFTSAIFEKVVLAPTNVGQAIFGTSSGWLFITVSGTYTVADFLDDFPTAREATSIAL